MENIGFVEGDCTEGEKEKKEKVFFSPYVGYPSPSYSS